ncbi:hypothetical protein QBC39DRAFT_358007 [Podospora conica]|nr:hypothetical protein QBC39DRAFT_358007 [Schizothecium conicum]
MLGSNAWIADEHDYPRSDLDTLRRQAWVDLRGLEAAYISRHRNAAMRITGKMASAMTSTFFGPKWMGGCAKRIIDIATKGPAIDIATRARQAVADHSNPIPDDFRTAFRAIGALMKSEQNDATFALDAYLDLVTLANTLKRIYSKMGTGDEELRLYAFGNASHSGKTRRQCLTEARKKLFTVCRITERQLIKLKEYSLLPQAAIENFGKGGLLFLPTSRDPARQLWGMRSGVASIMKSIKRSGQGSGDWLTVVAQRIKVEIVDRIENGEILGWDQGIVETLTPDMPILTILDKLRDSRSPREQVIKSETEDTDIHGMGGSFEDDEMHDA